MAYHDQIHPLHHTHVNWPMADGTSVRVILTTDGPFMPLFEYFRAGRNLKKSISWQNKLAQGVGYLIDFTIQAEETYHGDAETLFSDFGSALTSGTINLNGEDPRGLYWPKLSWQPVKDILSAVSEFNKWCHQKYDAKLVAPTESLTWGERIAKYHALDMKNKNSFFKHLRDAKTTWELTATADRPNFVTPIKIATRRPLFFPSDQFEELLYKGYRRPGIKANPDPDEKNVHKYFNTRDIMISILQGAGGLRESEPFHLYIDDVEEDPLNPGHALVKVRHPSEGLFGYNDPVTGKHIFRKRSVYLRMNGMVPRHLTRERKLHAGWKNPMLETDKNGDFYMRVFFFPSFWGKVFWKLYRNYIMYARPRKLKTPFLFVSMDKKHFGEPYSVKAYTKNHNKAVRRIGLNTSKTEGTSTHGLRHLYGHNLQASRVPKEIRQECMHHKSIVSQDPYTQPTVSQINKILKESKSETKRIVGVLEISSNEAKPRVFTF